MIDKTCWTCALRFGWGPATFLGVCKKDPDKPADIGPELVDAGCREWIQKEKKP